MTKQEVMFESTDGANGHGSDELSVDTRFKLLKNSRRRKIIDYLSEHDQPTTRSELAEVIAAEENGIDVSDLGSDQRKRVYVSLYQTHLPTLKRDGVIRYDPDRGTVERGPNMDELVEYLRVPPELSETPRVGHFTWLSLLGGTTYVLIRVVGGMMPGLMDLWAVGFVSAVFLVSMYHRRS